MTSPFVAALIALGPLVAACSPAYVTHEEFARITAPTECAITLMCYPQIYAKNFGTDDDAMARCIADESHSWPEPAAADTLCTREEIDQCETKRAAEPCWAIDSESETACNHCFQNNN